MRKFYGILLVGLMLLSVGSASAQQDVTVDVSLDGFYGYIWRGYVLGADDKIAIQPGLGLTFGETGFSAGAWGSAFVQSRTATKPADELDFWADYSKSLGEDSPIGISVGYIQYTFPNAASGSKHSEEAYIGISMDHMAAPSLTFYYDFGLVDGWYLAASIGPEFPLGEGDDAPALALSATASMSGEGGYGSTSFHDLTVSASIGFPMGMATITPIVGFSYADDKVNTSDGEIYGGVSISFSLGGE